MPSDELAPWSAGGHQAKGWAWLGQLRMASPVNSGPPSHCTMRTLLKAPTGTDLAVTRTLVLPVATAEAKSRFGGVVSCNMLEPWYCFPAAQPTTDTSYCITRSAREGKSMT